MIKRIVRMSFHSEKVEEFLSVFNANKDLIGNFNGCSHLELWNDIDHPSVFFTYSYWESEEFLEKYRQSELFNSVWSKTKILFNEKPQAWSVKVKYEGN